MTKKYRVFVPGAWDLFHVGHINLLQRARKMANKMIVGVDTDASIKKRKGQFPIVSFKDRVTILKACSGVDEVVSNQNGSLDATQLIGLGIEVVVVGSDWENKSLRGEKKVEESGIRIQYFPYTKSVSSTQIKDKINEKQTRKLKMRPVFEELRNKHDLKGVEIGVFRGSNALIYLKELNIKRIFLIDPYIKHEDYFDFSEKSLQSAEKFAHESLRDYENKITWMKAMSAEMAIYFADESLDFVYIDGNHQYRFVREDIALYYPKVEKGGLLSGHDYSQSRPGNQVIDAVNKFCKDNNLKLNVNGIDWWIWK